MWPDGIHVSLIIIDGIVAIPRAREAFPDRPDDFFVHPDDVAETAYMLTQQKPSAWSFEVEARPYLLATLIAGPVGLGAFLVRRALRLRGLGQLGGTDLV